MGGDITVAESTMDGSLKTMGGVVRIQNVVGDVKGSSMGGNVSYKNVRRRDGQTASPEHLGKGKGDINPDTVQISTMGGDIEVKDAPEGATFELLATDPGSKSDVPSWAELSGNELMSAESLEDGSFRYVIRKAA